MMRIRILNESRPLLRGYFHLAAALAAVAGFVVLLWLADSPRAYAGGAVFAVSLIALYAISGTYHTITWGRRAHAVLKRLDHAMIFVLIAGTYTPFCLLAASDAWGLSLVAATELADWFALVPLLLLGGGGLLYSAGGVIYALRRPDPFPTS